MDGMKQDSSRGPLTRRQKQILDYITEFVEAEGLPPTHREICEQFGFNSYGTVHKHLRLLREKGYLSRETHQKRGIKVLEEERNSSGMPELPFLGRIAAGQPIEVIEGRDSLPVPPHLISSRGEHFVLEVVGDSMIEEGIHEGDLVVVQQRDRAEVGQMVVALIDGEATVKRFYPEGKRVRLQPANRLMDPIFVAAEDLTVQGLVVGLMRRF
jgi:repressor LexA